MDLGWWWGVLVQEYDKCPTLMENVDGERGFVWDAGRGIGGLGVYENSALDTQFYFESKTAFKILKYINFKKLNFC